MHDHLSLICFIVCDSGPASHFAEFAKSLIAEDNLRIIIYASGPAQAKLQELHFPGRIDLVHFMLDGLNSAEEQNLAHEILTNCVTQGAQTIIVDIANKFDIEIQEAFNKIDVGLHNIRFWCYYDNPEEYVPGGYSIRSGEMIKLSQNILFANMNLIKRNSNIYSLPNVTINLNNKNIQSIGYYPIEIAERLEKQRDIERDRLREKYVYYEQAFPNFLSSLSQINEKKFFEDVIFLIHQHPAAKIKNQDNFLFQQWFMNNQHIQISLSQLTSDEAQIIADGILYYQTSMTPQFALLNLPIMQVGHEIYQDILIRYNLCEIATNSIDLINGLKKFKENNQLSNFLEKKQLIYDAIGYHSNWSNNLRNILLDIKENI